MTAKVDFGVGMNGSLNRIVDDPRPCYQAHRAQHVGRSKSSFTGNPQALN
jgi:hypothetical protein